jgi:hypothetical protein
MRVATNLAELGDLGTYQLHPDNDDTRFLQKAIGLLLPRAQFNGFLDKLSELRMRSLRSTADGPMPSGAARCPGISSCFRRPTSSAGNSGTLDGRSCDACTPGNPAVLPMAAFIDFLSRWEPPTVRARGGAAYTLLAEHEYYDRDVAQRTAFRSLGKFVESALANEESRRAYATVFEGAPAAVWEHYVRSVFSKTQYAQYVEVKPGDVVMSIGIDEGMELPWLCAQMHGQGAVYAIDPFGLDFLSRYVWQAVGCFPGLVREPQAWRSAATPGGQAAVLGHHGARQSAQRCRAQDTRDGAMLDRRRLRPAAGVAEGRPDQDRRRGGRGVSDRRHAANDPEASSADHHRHLSHLSSPLVAATSPDESCVPTTYFYLDHYGFKKWDTVFYAVPAEKVRPHYRTAPQPLLVLK